MSLESSSSLRDDHEEASDQLRPVESSYMTTTGEEVLYELLFANSINRPTHKRAGSHGYSSLGTSATAESKEESLMYLQELNAMHLDRLQSEPHILWENKQQIHEEIKNLAFSNYKTFIRTAQCSREIYSEFGVVESRLDELISRLPAFTDSCADFTRSIQSISASRRANNLTLHKHNQLLEILEISQLMDTCVRNEYYEEALELAAYVRRLDKKLSATVPVVQQIVDDCNKSLNLMLKQLLQQLRTGIQFNQCLKIIGIIRRLDVYTESELRFKFLQLRDSWLQSLLQGIPTIDPYNHISKTIEEYRIHLFDIITQYRAIFSDDDAASQLSQQQDKSIGSLLAASGVQRDALNESRLFYYWLQQKMRHFLQVLRKDLTAGVGNRLDSVLSQTMYFGLAFSRVGFDFRALAVPIFEEVAAEQMRKALANANLKFEESLNKVNWSEMYLERARSVNASLHQSIEHAANMAALADLANNKSKQATIVNPPIQLLEFHPLGIYLNTVLAYFNELRLCAPLNLHAQAFAETRSSLRRLGSFVAEYHKREKLDKLESELFTSFLYHLAHILIPYLEKCLSILFPLSQLQKVYSISQTELDKFKAKLKLDTYELLASIRDLVPPIKTAPVQETPKTEIVKEEEKKEDITPAVVIASESETKIQAETDVQEVKQEEKKSDDKVEENENISQAHVEVVESPSQPESQSVIEESISENVESVDQEKSGDDKQD